MEKGKIYIPLQGRIGNQLFQYAFARKLQIEMGVGTEIIIDDSDILRCKWENSLQYYALPNVRYVHNGILLRRENFKQYLLRKVYRLFTRKKDYVKKYRNEFRIQPFLNRHGLFICENGYIEPHINLKKPVYLEGYFQSEKYFELIKDDLFRLFDGNQFELLKKYRGVDLQRNSNSICISVKVEHNVGNSMYNVCSVNYWKRAIEYIISKVEQPFFFICSDNVDYVLEHLIDTDKFNYMLQDKKMPAHVSLAAMALCKHFVIGNTTFGWWAQYLSLNQDKIVVAPSRWMNIEMPIDIYQHYWHLVEV